MTETKPNPQLYRLINPCDAYTFFAPSIEVAGVCVAMMATQFGAENTVTGEGTPVMFGWDQWIEERGLTNEWCDEHIHELIACYETFILSTPESRIRIEENLSGLDPESRRSAIVDHNESARSSMTNIGNHIVHVMNKLRIAAEKLKASSNGETDSEQRGMENDSQSPEGSSLH